MTSLRGRISLRVRPFVLGYPVVIGCLILACGGGTIGPGGPGTSDASGDDASPLGWGGEGDAGGGGSGGMGRGGQGGMIVLKPWGSAASGGAGASLGGTGPLGGGGAGGSPMGRSGAGGVGRGGASGGGRGGAGGAGRGGGGGRGGGTCGPTEPPTSCPASLCGNDRIDSCFVRWGVFPTCYQYYFVEGCDGTDLGGLSCQTWGYPSGTLRCAADCTLDASGCSECTDDPTVVRCGPRVLPGNPASVAMAATEAEVGMAGIAYDNDGRPELSLTRFSPSLDIVGSVRIEEPAISESKDSYVYGLALAPLPSGWVIAAFSGTELLVHAVDADGLDVGRQVVVKASWTSQSFVPRPDGGPLLVWMTSEPSQNYYYNPARLFTAVVAADGLSVSAPVEVPLGDRFLTAVGRGAFVGGSFYVPLSVTGYGYPDQVRIARFATDGALISVTDPLPENFAWTPNLVAGTNELHLTYSGVVPYGYFGYGYSALAWQRVDLTGTATGSPLPIAPGNSVGTAVALGDDTVQMVAGGYNTLELIRVKAKGEVVEPHSLVATSNNLSVSWFDVVARGPDVVIAWRGGYENRLMMARVRP